MKRKILIVDDIVANRIILKSILGDEYETAEASNGREALDMIAEGGYSAVLLDLLMPVIDGYSVLKSVRSGVDYAQLPIIVMTGQTEESYEEKAFELGANDYISKPYKPAIIKQRIRGAIRLWETAAAVNALKRDALTGLYSRSAFLAEAAELVAAKPARHYIMAYFDIDKFRVINDQYGTKKGDEVLRYIAKVFGDGFGALGGIACRLSADNFAVLYPSEFAESKAVADMRRMASRVDGLVAPISFSIGRYEVSDTSVSPSAMLDRAALAAETVKGQFTERIAYYDENMRRRLILEQEIVTEMSFALRVRQFEAWYQPQYNHLSGALVGSEALVRWRHPQKGLISPAVFVPIFEKNGFIYELDKFVWEEVCRSLSEWLAGGLSPLPVSVNISRYDIFRPDLVSNITGLLEKYKLPVSLLRLEITESAFAEDTDIIIKVVKELIDYGFTVEIDDFGSGYSSLNTLKSVPAQVLKLDMRFMEERGDSERGGNIIESIVRMTKWLGMSVIAEGVEKKEQADYLASIGCKYIQGYLYSKPTPKAGFEKLLKSSGKEEKILKLETVEHLDNNAFWDPKSMDSLIFNSYIGSACIFEYHSGRVELLRVSKKYTELVESAGMPIDTALALNWTEHLGESDRATLSAALNESAKTYSEVTLELAFTGLNTQGRKTYLRSTMRVIVSTGDRYLVYCLAENMTAQREAERNERRVMQQLQAVMENVNCGITAVAISGDKVEYQLANDKYFDIIGYSREEFFGGNGIDPFTTIDKADIEYVQATISRVAKTGKPESMEYRGIHKGGRRIWLRSHISMTNFVDKGLVQLTTYTDITEEKETKSHLETLTENIPGGIASFEFEDGSMKLAYFNDGFLRLFGLSRREYTDFTQDEILRMIDKDDLPQLKSQIAELKNDGKRLDAVFRVHLSGGGFKWLNLKASRSAEGTAAIIINSVVFDITMRQEALESLRISEEENRLAIAHSRSVVCRYDVASKTLRVSPRVNDIFTVPKNISDIPYSQIREGKVAPDSAETYIAFYNAIARGEKSGKMTFKRMSTVGWRWITANFSTIFSSDGKPVSAVISFEDVTDELEKEAVYRKWRQSLQGRDAESYSLFRCNVTRLCSLGMRRARSS